MLRYLLLTDAITRGPNAPAWRFALHGVDNDDTVTATDREYGVSIERLELMAVVRGLEALEQPARVKLVTNSKYVRRGIKRGLREWRARGWAWERFGRVTEVRDADLWRRVDRAMEFHRVHLRGWRSRSQSASKPRMASVSATQERKRSATVVNSSRLSSEEATQRVASAFVVEPALMIVRGQRRRKLSLAAAG